jgi:hypothetical protein
MGDEFAPGLPPEPTQGVDEPTEATDIRVPQANAMAVFFAWEKLRVLFNALYALALCYVTSGLRGIDERFFVFLLIVVLLLNAVFSVGPVVEGYLCWFGSKRLFARWLALVAVNLGVAGIFVIWAWR